MTERVGCTNKKRKIETNENVKKLRYIVGVFIRRIAKQFNSGHLRFEKAFTTS